MTPEATAQHLIAKAYANEAVSDGVLAVWIAQAIRDHSRNVKAAAEGYMRGHPCAAREVNCECPTKRALLEAIAASPSGDAETFTEAIVTLLREPYGRDAVARADVRGGMVRSLTVAVAAVKTFTASSDADRQGQDAAENLLRAVIATLSEQ